MNIVFSRVQIHVGSGWPISQSLFGYDNATYVCGLETWNGWKYGFLVSRDVFWIG